MRTLFSRFWADDGGAILSTEMLFIISTMIIGSVAGWAGLRAALVTELTETGNSILQLNQAWSLHGISAAGGGSGGATAGTNLFDTPGFLTISANQAPVQTINDQTVTGWNAVSP